MKEAARLVLAFCLATGPAASGEARRPVDIHAAPFASIGRVNNGSYGRCTGTLIARQVAVTAAHCLFNRATKRFVRPQSVHFVLGYDRGRYLFQATAASVSIAPSYDPTRPFETAGDDWALLHLGDAAPADARIMPVAADMPQLGQTYLAAGFGRDRAEALTTAECAFAGRTEGRLAALSCSVIQGYSGGPLIDPHGRLAGIVVATGRGPGGADTAFAVPAAAWTNR